MHLTTSMIHLVSVSTSSCIQNLTKNDQKSSLFPSPNFPGEVAECSHSTHHGPRAARRPRPNDGPWGPRSRPPTICALGQGPCTPWVDLVLWASTTYLGMKVTSLQLHFTVFRHFHPKTQQCGLCEACAWGYPDLS